jgi:hypothetical protein
LEEDCGRGQRSFSRQLSFVRFPHAELSDAQSDLGVRRQSKISESNACHAPLPALAGTSLAGHPVTTSFDVVLQRQPSGYWIANRNRMLPISILLVSAEVGQARLRAKPGDDTQSKHLFCGVSLPEVGHLYVAQEVAIPTGKTGPAGAGSSRQDPKLPSTARNDACPRPGQALPCLKVSGAAAKRIAPSWSHCW